jgi:hypothetical protein
MTTSPMIGVTTIQVTILCLFEIARVQSEDEVVGLGRLLVVFTHILGAGVHLLG